MYNHVHVCVWFCFTFKWYDLANAVTFTSVFLSSLSRAGLDRRTRNGRPLR